ncbi:uncharacterized protein LOC123013350 [Tribolium madens]|uniref:uncharacterized protein LOC123013350 n=1 Tax=Tribolium madens TaxID=41895 RepID=UPI001CF7454E|nr:uncharacterized protein LOC123013350 [Tribolium madens]
MDNEKFSIRDEAIDVGKDYEYLIPAYYALIFAFNENVIDFKLSTNNRDYGDFDDVIIEIEFKNGEEHVFALQLKHIKRTIAQITLITNNKKFSLNKYSKEFRTVKTKHSKSSLGRTTFKNFHFILFSNSSLEKSEDFNENWNKLEPVANDKKIESDVLIKKIEACFVKDLLNISDLGEIFIFKSQKENSTDEEFFKQFYFFTKQKNTKEVESSIRAFMMKKFKNCNSNILLNYLNFFNHWCSREYGNLKVTKQDVKLKIAELILAPHIPEPNTERLKNIPTKEALEAFGIFATFDLILFDNISNQGLDRIWEIVLQELVPFDYDWEDPLPGFYERKFLKTFPLSAFSENYNEITLKKMYIMNWHAGRVPLVIKPDKYTIDQNDVSVVLKLIKSETGKNKIVLISNTNEIDTSGWKVFKDFSDLKTHCCLSKTLFDTMTVSLQGRPNTSLKQFLENDEHLLKAFTSNEFVSMLDDTLLIGDDCKKDLPEYYITRKVSKILLNSKVITALENDLFIISVDDNYNLQNIFNINTIDIKQYLILKQRGYLNTYTQFSLSYLQKLEKTTSLNNRFCILTKNDCSIEERESICCLNNDKNCHFVRFIDTDRIEWIHSQGDIRDLQNYQIDLKFLNVDAFVDDLQVLGYFKNRLNIICTDPGMGKSITTNYLKYSSSNNTWVITVKLNLHINFFKEKRSISEVINYLLSSEKKSQLVKNIINVFESKKQLVFFWDGFDEVPKEALNGAIEAVKSLNHEGYIQWLAARTSLKKFLEWSFNSFALTLIPFTSEDQFDYIRWHLKNKIQNEESVDAFTNKINEDISTSFNSSYLDYAGSPLHIHMLTEIYLRRLENKMDDYQFVTLTDMYKHFIKGKFDTMFERAEADSDNYFMEEIRNHYKTTQINLYEIAAVKSRFDNVDLNCDELVDEIFTNGDSLGLIVGLTTERKVIFAHKTYEEFLSASWLSKNWKQHKDLVLILFEDEYNGIRYMFDLLLANDNSVHLAVLHRNLNMLENHKDEIINSKDKVGRNALHVACSWGRKHPVVQVVENEAHQDVIERTSEECQQLYEDHLLYLSHRNKNISKIIDILSSSAGLKMGSKIFSNLYNQIDTSPVHSLNAVTISTETLVKVFEEDENYLKILEFLLTYHCNPLDHDNLLEWNAFQYADKTFCLAAINVILKYCEINISQTLNYCNHIPTLLHYSVLFFYDKILDNIDDIPYIEYKYQFGRNSMLQQATECNNLKAASTLLQFQSYKDGINNQSAFLGNPLSSACSFGNLEMVDLLLQNGSDVHGHKLPPIFAATLYNRSECCKKILEAGTDINEISENGNSPLMLSTMLQLLDMTELLLQNGADINFVYEDFSILQMAVGCGSIDLVKLLLKYKPNINRQCETLGYTTLHHASEMSSVEVVEILLKHGANPKIKSKKLFTPLHTALTYKNFDIALKLIEADPSIVNEFSLEDNGDKLTPMILAAENNCPEVIKVLHKCGAELYIAENILNPLHVAVGNGHVSAAIALIDAGASVNQPNTQGVYPLYCATKHLSTLTILLKNSAKVNAKCPDGLTALHLAAIYGKVDVVEELVKSGAEVNDEDLSGNTPLVYSVLNKHLDVLKFLLENGAKVGKNSKLLCIAARDDFPECIPILVQNGANVNTKNIDKVFPLHLALIASNSCVEVLLNNGANPNVKFLDNISALHVAAVKRDIFSTVLLTNYGADVNVVNSEGLTPLHILSDGDQTPEEFKNITNCENILDQYFVSYNYQDCIKELISKNANPNLQNNNGATPLHYACKYRNAEIIELLIDGGADVNVQTDEKQTPLHIAIALGKMQVVDLLLKKGAVLDITDIYGNKPIDYALKAIASQEMINLREEELEKIRLLGANINSPVKPNGTTLLHLACIEGNFKIVQYLIENNADIKQKTTDDGASPLSYACINNHKQIVSLLLKNNCNINTQTKEGNTVLHLSVLKGNKEIVEILLDFGIDVNIRNAYGVTALQLSLKLYTLIKNSSAETNLNEIYSSTNNLSHSASILQFSELVKMLLNQEVVVDETILLEAVTSNDLDLVSLLVKRNQNLNFNNENLIETVMNAEVKNEDLLNYLLENGLDPNCLIGETNALHKACKIDCCGYVKCLLQHGAEVNSVDKKGITPLMTICSNKDLQIANLLLDHDADVNQIDNHGQSALFYACYTGNLELVKLLHKRGANISLETTIGAVPLMVACRHKSVIKYLIENGTDVNHKNKDMVTALHCACSDGEYEFATILIENKANVNAVTVDGYTPIYLSSVGGHLDIINLLIQSKAEIDIPNNHGNTSLFAAAARGYLSIVELLYENGANINVIDEDGDTPLHDAACYGYFNVVQYLVTKNADLAIKNYNGKTPLDLAVEKGHNDVVDFLKKIM